MGQAIGTDMTITIIKRLLISSLFVFQGLLSLPLSAQTVQFQFEDTTDYTNELIQHLNDLKVFEKLTSFTSQNITLTSDITFNFYSGDSVFFDASESRIFVPYSYLVELNEGLYSKYPQQEIVREEIFASAVEQLLWFELGRALVNQFSLPLLGKEEIALDEFAVLMLLQFNSRAQDYLLDSAEAYLLIDDARSLLDGTSQQQQVALDEERYRRIVCIILGRDFEPYVKLVDESAWDEKRLSQCEDRFKARLIKWYQRLKPYLKDSSPMHQLAALVEDPTETEL